MIFPNNRVVDMDINFRAACSKGTDPNTKCWRTLSKSGKGLTVHGYYPDCAAHTSITEGDIAVRMDVTLKLNNTSVPNA